MSGPSPIQEEGFVEVQTKDADGIWYSATLLDVNDRTELQVTFEKDVWPAMDLPARSVRRAPIGTSASDGFIPKPGDHVEVQVVGSDSSPPGWALATVKLIKSEFFFIVFEKASPNGQSDMIVEKAHLRRVHHSRGLLKGDVVREGVSVEEGLEKWVLSADAQGCFNQVATKAGLMRVGVDKRTRGSVLLLGDETAIRRGMILLDVHLKHQREIQRFHDRRQNQLRVLEERRAKYAEAITEELFVDDDLVGLVIGKNGDNLRAIQEKYKVEVVVEKTTKITDTVRRVRIMGESRESVDQAKAEVDYIKDQFEMGPDQFYVVFGSNRRALEDIRERSGAWRLRYAQEKSMVELSGLRGPVEDAMLMLDCNLQYYTVYAEMQREQETLEGNIAELDGRNGFGSKSASKGSDSYGKGGFRREGKDYKGGKGDNWRNGAPEERWERSADKGEGKGKRANGKDAKKEEDDGARRRKGKGK